MQSVSAWRATLQLRACAALALTLLAATSTAQVAERRYTQTPAGTKVEEVLVTGEHPGPGLWRVTNGENTLYILGTHSPLPRALRWRSQEIEIAISEAQQVLASYSASFTLRGANPLATEGKPLRRVLSRKAYAQWRALKAKYIGDNDEVERALPVTAALILRSSAYERAGLTNADSIWREIVRLANEYHVPVTNDHQVTKVVGDVSMDADAARAGVDFLVRTMTSLEADLREARALANAWAIGDLDALRARAHNDDQIARLYATSWPFLTAEEIQALTVETNEKWLAAADKALRRNRTSVASLPIFLLLQPQGLLDGLRARGFEVDEPRG